MRIEHEIRNYLLKNLKENINKIRDIEIILYYYGFTEDLWPTLEDAAEEYKVGEKSPGNRRSERPRQIIQDKFKEFVKIEDLPSLYDFSKKIASNEIYDNEQLTAYAAENGYFDKDENLISTIRMLHDLGSCKDYGLYTLTLNPLTKSTYRQSEQYFLIAQEPRIEKLKKDLRKARTLPGLLGIAKLDFLESKLSDDLSDFEYLMNLLKLDPDSWFYKNKAGDEYYLFESRDNTLVNNLEKIRNVSSQANIDELTQTLSNSLRARAHKYTYPPDKIIRKYLRSSKHTSKIGKSVLLNVEKGPLTKIDKDIIEYSKAQGTHNFSSISNYLKKLGYGKPFIDKSVMKSPLVHVNKEGGRGHYKYSLVGNTSSVQNPEESRYERFRQKLILATRDGSDSGQKTKARREQSILSEWLFEGKSKDKCALCNKEYSVKSLVTAHKKKRSKCAENERRDPRIVLPLCLFGCDYLYEHGYVYIESGLIRKATTTGNLCKSEIKAIEALSENRVRSKWLKGNPLYFRKPEESA